jgi:glycosyltransferase involved in cell wall biosynthesis
MSAGSVLQGPSVARGAEVVRVLQFLAAFAMGGTERQAFNLAHGLDRSRFEPHFACFRVMGDFLADIEATRSPLRKYEIKRLYGGRTLRQQLRFARDLRQSGVDVVHAYGFYANVFAIPAARLAGVHAIVASIRDTGDHLTPNQRRVQRLACYLADAILVNAEAVKQRLVGEGYDGDRITVIGNGVTLSRFGPRNGNGRRRRELGFPPEAPLVAVFCRLNRLKGVDHFLEAAARVATRFPYARFAVVGEGRVVENGVIVEGAYRRELEAQAARLGLGGRVVFTGLRGDVPELLGEVTVSVLPSLSEGLSNAILESMAAGVPVVATAVGGNAEAVKDGVTGLLVPPGNSAALAGAICTLLEDEGLATRFGRAGRQRVEERFSEERMVRDTQQFYLSLLARKGRRCAASNPKESPA